MRFAAGKVIFLRIPGTLRTKACNEKTDLTPKPYKTRRGPEAVFSDTLFSHPVEVFSDLWKKLKDLTPERRSGSFLP
jgi:hypothetical protein